MGPPWGPHQARQALAAAALLTASLVGCATAAPPSSACKVFANIDFNGHDLHKAHGGGAADPAGCCAACGAAKGCGFWTFMPPQTCYLKTSDQGRRPSPRAGKGAYTSGIYSSAAGAVTHGGISRRGSRGMGGNGAMAEQSENEKNGEGGQCLIGWRAHVGAG